MAETRETLIIKAKLAEETERFEGTQSGQLLLDSVLFT